MKNKPTTTTTLLSLTIIAVIVGFSLIYYQNHQLKTALTAVNKQVTTLKIHQKNLTTAITKLNTQPHSNQKKEILSKKTYQIDELNSVEIGKKTAAVTITIWTDFQCPYCAKSAPIIEQLQKKYTDNIRFLIKHYPLPVHRQAKIATKYALAAHKQNAYLPMYLKIFQNYKKLKTNPDFPLDIAKELNLNIDQLLIDIKNPSLEKQIETEMNQLKSLGIRLAVPKYFINGKEYSGQRSLNSFSVHIDNIINQSKDNKKINKI